MKEYKIKDLDEVCFFSKPAYLDKSFVVVAPEMPFTKELAKILEKWNFQSVFSDGQPREEYTVDKTRDEIVDVKNIKSLSMQTDADKLQKADNFYNNLLAFTEKLFIKINISDELEYKVVYEKIKDTVEYLKEDRRFIMRIIKNTELVQTKSYLAAHSVRSTIIAIIIGTYLKLLPYRLIELGIAALLHEVGMLKLPPQLYMSDRPFSPQEKRAMTTHPILGYNILKGHDFPLSVCLAALEHHERENGIGYPRNLQTEKISLYSKIIAVACSYEALSTKRPHKEAKDGYAGMLELLKNEGKMYDDTVVKALVISLSIYPIGLYVLLSNGRKGQVVDVNPENPKFPVVQVFGEFTPDGKVKTAQTSLDEIYIVRPLTRSEIDS